MLFIVTGGAGFIGSHLIKKIIANHSDDSNLKIHVLDCLTYASNIDNLPLNDNRVELFQIDISSMDQIYAYMKSHQEIRKSTIFHLAAESHVDRSIIDGSNFISTNITGTFNMLSLAREVDAEKFIHVSTDEVYGSIDFGEANEENNLNPSSYYSSSKAASDLIALASFKTLSTPVIVTRCVNNFGENQHPEKFLPRMVGRLARGLALPLYGDGTNIREWIHVEDHVNALIAVSRSLHFGEVFNIGSGFRLSNIEILNSLMVISDSTSRVDFVQDRLGHDKRYALNSTKIADKTGWSVTDTKEKFKAYINESIVKSREGNFIPDSKFNASEEFYNGI